MAHCMVYDFRDLQLDGDANIDNCHNPNFYQCKALLTRYGIEVRLHEYFRGKEYSDFEYCRPSFTYGKFRIGELVFEQIA